jgi:hypothetical protein
MLDFLQDIVLIIPVAIIIGINSLVNIIPRTPLLRLKGIIEYLFDVGEEFSIPTCIIDCWKITCYNIPTTNCTSGATKFLPDVKEIFDKPPKGKKRKSRYDIYK